VRIYLDAVAAEKDQLVTIEDLLSDSGSVERFNAINPHETLIADAQS
jgi:hypothetical protein